jgi:hypothetical protein
MQELLKLVNTTPIGNIVIVLISPLLAFLVILVATMVGLSKEFSRAAHPLR